MSAPPLHPKTQAGLYRALEAHGKWQRTKRTSPQYLNGRYWSSMAVGVAKDVRDERRQRRQQG
jgi:hypothetical protein